MRTAMLWRIAIALLCVACGCGNAQAAVAFSAGGAIVQFPGPQAQIRQDPPDPQVILSRSQKAPTPEDPQRELTFAQLRFPFYVNLVARIAPEVMMDRAGSQIAAGLAASLNNAEFGEPEKIHVNGHPGFLLSATLHDDMQQPAPPGGKPPSPHSFGHISFLMLWTGESMVILTVHGNQPTTNDAFLQSVRTTTTVQPGDADAQMKKFCVIGGVIVLVLLLLLIWLLVALVIFVDKTLKRRKRARQASATLP